VQTFPPRAFPIRAQRDDEIARGCRQHSHIHLSSGAMTALSGPGAVTPAATKSYPVRSFSI